MKPTAKSNNNKNPLLIKDQQGKVKQTVYNLPTQNHTYGKKVIDDPQPIKYVVNAWKEAQLSSDPQPTHKNFKQLNKLSTKNGFYTAKDQTQLRKTHDIMVQSKKGQKVIPIMLPQQQFTYGVANRPSTPVKLVIGNCYAIQNQQKNAQKYMRQTQIKQAQKNKKLQAHKTKSQLLRQQKTKQQKDYRSKPNIQQKFKISKFANSTITKIDTRLSKQEGINNLTTSVIQK